MLTIEDWQVVGRNTVGQLPPHEREPFVHWVETHRQMTDLYNRFPGKALREWWDSAERYALVKPEDL